MNDAFNHDELSAEDLAILQAFDEMDMVNWEGEGAQKDTSTQPPGEEEAGEKFLAPEEMLALFVGEADEDITTIRRTLQQLEPDDHLDAAHLQIIQRTAHKLKGTTGAVGCMVMSTIAHHLEDLVKQIINGAIVPFIGLNALVQTAHALEKTLISFVTNGEESSNLLAELETEYKALNINIAARPAERPGYAQHVEEEQAKDSHARVPFKPVEEVSPVLKPAQEHQPAPFVRVDVHRFEQLVQHSEQLAELSNPLENAQAEVEKALQELHVAEARLRHMEGLLATQLAARRFNAAAAQSANDERPTSSLVARILDESAQRTGKLHQHKSKAQPQSPKPPDSLQWDELEIDRFTESDFLVHSLGEAVADVTTASSQLRTAIAQLNCITRQHIDQATNVRNDTLLLRLAPISMLLARIERAVMMSPLAQQQRVLFEVEGAATEIDQDILEELKHPLLQLVRTCTAHRSTAPEEVGGEESGNAVNRTWLHARAIGNEVTIEVGFSMVVGGGALDEVQEAIRRLNGTIVARRNSLGGISFHLRLPRSQGALQGFLVKTGSHRVVVPFSQVQRIDDGKQRLPEHLYILHSLLGFPAEHATEEGVRPVLILPTEAHAMAVQVDDILGEVKLLVKPLAPHLQRPGIAGVVIDAMGNILLVVDLPGLINHYEMQESTIKIAAIRKSGKQAQYPTQRRQSILIADDSVYIRKSLRQTLTYAGYQVREADDGMKTLERLLDDPPHALLLDIEMPNLSGYDVLSMMRVHPELARVKTIMLTSRSSEKHQERARELGAQAFLTKPCPQDLLLETLRSLLTS
jgi:chemosensory pili system protein ChpA (sensor histidine kinase/response regulator)